MDFAGKARDEFKAILAGEFSETVTVTTGNNSVSVRAIFDETYQVVDPETNVVVMSTKPRVTVWQENVTFALTVGVSRVSARSKSYRVKDIQPDGEGSVTLYLD